MRISPENWQIMARLAHAYEFNKQPLDAAAVYEKLLGVLPQGHEIVAIEDKIRQLRKHGEKKGLD